MQKTEWPTEGKLQELREKGIIPYSTIATRGAVLVFVVLTLYGEREVFSHLSKTLDISSDIGRQEYIDAFVKLIVGPAISAIFVTAIVGLCQTGFYFRFPGFALGRLFTSSSEMKISTGILSLLVGVVLVVSVSFVISHEAFNILNNGSDYLRNWTVGMLSGFVPYAILVISLVAFLSWLIARFRFMFSYRMTREEVRREQLNQE